MASYRTLLARGLSVGIMKTPAASPPPPTRIQGPPFCRRCAAPKEAGKHCRNCSANKCKRVNGKAT